MKAAGIDGDDSRELITGLILSANEKQEQLLKERKKEDHRRERERKEQQAKRNSKAAKRPAGAGNKKKMCKMEGCSKKVHNNDKEKSHCYRHMSDLYKKNSVWG